MYTLQTMQVIFVAVIIYLLANQVLCYSVSFSVITLVSHEHNPDPLRLYNHEPNSNSMWSTVIYYDHLSISKLLQLCFVVKNFVYIRFCYIITTVHIVCTPIV